MIINLPFTLEHIQFFCWLNLVGLLCVVTIFGQLLHKYHPWPILVLLTYAAFIQLLLSWAIKHDTTDYYDDIW